MEAALRTSENLFSRLVLKNSPETLSSPAIRVGSATLTYSELAETVRSLADSLSSCGVEERDRIAVMLGNSPEYVIAFFAVTLLGGIVVPVEEKTGPERLRFILEETDPRILLHKSRHGLPENFGVPQAALTLDRTAKTVQLSGSGAGTRDSTLSEDSPTRITGDHAAAILFSGGSTGRPKGVVLEHGHLLTIAETLSGVIAMGADHRDLILNPLTHSGAWQRVGSTFLAGGQIVFPERPFSIPTLVDDIQSQGISGFFTTPPFIRMMLRSPAERFHGKVDRCRSIEIASAPLSPDELRQLMALFPNAEIFFQYGLTECSRALILDTRKWPDKLHTIGKPTRGVQVAIAAHDGTLLKAGAEGEILLAAGQRTNHYWQRPDLDAERFRGEWLHTGDIGRVDEDGFVVLRGRKDDMINCGGNSFFPAEVEVELGQLEGVEAYLVAGVPDPQGILTQVPWIFVVPACPEVWSPDQLMALARQRLPSHMAPRNVVVIPELPKTSVGKPSRKLAVELYGPKAS